MNNFWDQFFLGNTVRDWTISIVIIFASMFLLRMIRTILLKRLQAWASKSSSVYDDYILRIFRRSVMPILYLGSIYAGLQYLTIPSRADRIMHVAIMIITVFFVIRIIADIMSFAFERLAGNQTEAQTKQARGILIIVKILLWIIGVIFLIDNLGYDITTIVAGLGIGGIAIALAAQTILGDLFSYLVIFFDKPFETGDFIIVGSNAGIVDYVGIKTTRIRTLSGEQLIVSNTDLTNSRVQNFKRMQRRRVVFNLRLFYNTGSENLRKVPGIVKSIIDPIDQATFDRAHLMAFGDYSLNFEIVYYIESSDYVAYMDVNQEICLAIYEQFEKEGIEFAFPAQKLLFDPSKNTDQASGSQFTAKLSSE